MSNFILKKGKVIVSHKMTSAITEKNMTDELAIELLRKSKGHIKSFASYPENWEAIVAGTSDNTPNIGPSKTQMKKRAKAVGLNPDATLVEIEAAEAKVAAAKEGEETEARKARAIACGLSEDAAEEDIIEIEAELKERAEAIGFKGELTLANIEAAEEEFRKGNDKKVKK